MTPEQPYDPNPRRVISSRILPTAARTCAARSDGWQPVGRPAGHLPGTVDHRRRPCPSGPGRLHRPTPGHRTGPSTGAHPRADY